MKLQHYLLLSGVVLSSCAAQNDQVEREKRPSLEDSEPETLVFRGSDRMLAQLLPELAKAYRKENPNVSFDIAAQGGWPPTLDMQAEFMMNGGIIATSRQIRAEDREQLETRVFELSQLNQAEQVVGPND